MEDFTLLRWHSATQKRVERAKQKDQVDNKARLFGKSIVKTKHQSLTNLASMRLVLGANRVVRHICIRCMAQYYNFKILDNFDGACRAPKNWMNQMTPWKCLTGNSLNFSWSGFKKVVLCSCVGCRVNSAHNLTSLNSQLFRKQIYVVLQVRLFFEGHIWHA